MKFKVGDKVEITGNLCVSKGRKGYITKIIDNDSCEVKFTNFKYAKHLINDLKLIEEKKLTKNQRITSLEERVTALEEIAKQLQENNITIEDVKTYFELPSTIEVVKDKPKFIEFEGQFYKKVDREAREGDVVVFKESNSYCVTAGKPYKTFINGRLYFKDNEGDGILVYGGCIANGTPETVEVYEPYNHPVFTTTEGQDLEAEYTEQVKQEVQHKTIECPAQTDKVPLTKMMAEKLSKTPNQLRAEVIEKAKGFIDKCQAYRKGDDRTFKMALKGNGTFNNHFYETDFFTKGHKVTAVVYLLWFGTERQKEPRHIGRAYCSEVDVFNEHIGKAIALGRALGLDVSEFEQAVQPTVAIEGMILSDGERKLELTDKTYVFKKTCQSGSWYARNAKIINDTNAIYEEVK